MQFLVEVPEKKGKLMREILESINFAEVTPLGKGSKRFRKLLGALMAVREIEAGRKKGIPLKKALDGL
jgi:hypothetical protein